MANAALKNIEESIRKMTPVSASKEDEQNVVALSHLIDQAKNRDKSTKGFQLVDPNGVSTPLPEAMLYLIERVAKILARGDAVSVVPVGKELTTQQAADILNISRQYLVRLLDQKRMPYTKTGKHRRLRIEDVLVFKKQRDRDRIGALDELSELTEEFVGYGEME